MVRQRSHFHFAEERDMATGKKPASDAGKQLGNKGSTSKEKEVAASALSQAPKKGSKAVPPAKKK